MPQGFQPLVPQLLARIVTCCSDDSADVRCSACKAAVAARVAAAAGVWGSVLLSVVVSVCARVLPRSAVLACQIFAREFKCVVVTIFACDCIKNALQFHAEESQQQLPVILHAA